MLIISALGVVFGGLFIGWFAMQLIGEKLARYAAAGVALVAVVIELKFDTPEGKMSSISLLAGLAILLVAIFRPRSKKAVDDVREGAN